MSCSGSPTLENWDGKYHHPLSYNRHLVDLLIKAGEAHGMRLFGLEAIELLRLDKGYRAIRRELAPDITPLEAGLERFVKLDKGDFIGRQALVEQARAGLWAAHRHAEAARR